ncbi:hypothetical protein [uncultured Chryseobacterium sp.]|uniref:hypothetical protein n=1 Tax=uncultured Chryseobacterium sp. TaxID=259322 RepID=UPI0025E26FE2|nr:hypothetical protein [uncultured Chryseobacterium sp.]
MKRIYFLSYSHIAIRSIRMFAVSFTGNLSTEPVLRSRRIITLSSSFMQSGSVHPQNLDKHEFPAEPSPKKDFSADLPPEYLPKKYLPAVML